MQGQIQQRRLIGRPPGLFAVHQAALLRFLTLNPTDCAQFDTDAALATFMGKSETQVRRYLRRLKADGKIKIKIQRWRFKGNWCVRRKITVVQEA